MHGMASGRYLAFGFKRGSWWHNMCRKLQYAPLVSLPVYMVFVVLIELIPF